VSFTPVELSTRSYVVSIVNHYAKIVLRSTVFRLFYPQIWDELSATTKNVGSSWYVLHVCDIKELSELCFSRSIGSRNIASNRGSITFHSGTQGQSGRSAEHDFVDVVM
jgi:hypothetical protein